MPEIPFAPFLLLFDRAKVLQFKLTGRDWICLPSVEAGSRREEGLHVGWNIQNCRKEDVEDDCPCWRDAEVICRPGSG